MSQPSHAHPVRRRAGLLSALTRLYTAVRRLIDLGGSDEEALEIQQKLHDRYTAYIECHETALVEVPERETSLNTSHVDVANVTKNTSNNCRLILTMETSLKRAFICEGCIRQDI